MKSVYKYLGLAVLTVVVFFGLMGGKWYSFATSGEISKTEGVFGNKTLEIWIDLNAWMPAPAREWACAVLMARQTEVMGRPGAVPHTCQPDYGVPDDRTRAEQLIDTYIQQAAPRAAAKGASAEQQKAVTDCVITAIQAGMTPELTADLNGEFTQDAIRAVNTLAREATNSCLQQQGF